MCSPTPDPVVLMVTPADSTVPVTNRLQNSYSHRYRQFYQDKSQSQHEVRHQEENFDDSPIPSSIKKKPLVVELNSADTLTLQLLHGIGPVFAQRIVRYRDQLGGFYCVEQLREVYGMTEGRYQSLVPHLTVTTDSIRYIDINRISVKELMRHPYIDAYLARDIIRYRDKGHPYRSVDDLRLVATMDDTTLVRLMPYLRFE